MPDKLKITKVLQQSQNESLQRPYHYQYPSKVPDEEYNQGTE